jgi:HEAT repeat protein
MIRITTAVVLMVLGLSALGFAQESSYTWVETRFHRVHLRNGNFIDGNVTGLTEREVSLKLQQTGDMNIRRDSIDRIELIKMRSLLEKPKLDPPLKKMVAKPTAVGARNPGALEPIIAVPQVEAALKSNVSAVLGRMRIATPDQKEELLVDLSRMPNAAPYLASQMGTVNDECVEYVGRALGMMKDPESLPYIAAHLDSTREIVVIQSLKLIAELDDPNWARCARPLLNHSQGAIRSTAIFTLARLFDRDSLPAILDSLGDSERSVRSGAIVASINLARKFNEVEIVSKAFRMTLRNPGKEALVDLLSGAGRLMDPALWDAVALYLRESDADIRAAAADALGTMVAKDAVEPLLSAMRQENDRKVRLSMARAATAIKSVKLMEPLVGWLKDEDEDIARMAHKSLEAISGKRMAPDQAAWAAYVEAYRDR